MMIFRVSCGALCSAHNFVQGVISICEEQYRIIYREKSIRNVHSSFVCIVPIRQIDHLSSAHIEPGTLLNREKRRAW